MQFCRRILVTGLPTVKRLEKQYMREQLRSGEARPKVIGIDEIPGSR